MGRTRRIYSAPVFATVPPPSQRLLVFARLPELGHVKTRLAADTGEERALAVYEAMLRDLVASIGESTVVAPLATSQSSGGSIEWTVQYCLVQ